VEANLSSQHVPAASIWFPDDDRAEILRMIDEALQSGRLTLGPIGANLETEFAARHQVQHAIAVASGTSALEIVLRAVGVAGREVVVPANTFHATAAAVIAAGATPRFADCDPATLALDPASVAGLLGPQTAAVVVVHIGGFVAPSVRELQALCDQHGVALVEDAAHAHGSSLDGQFAGTFGVAGTFSFYPTKVIAGGEGGMIVTNDQRIADEARIYRDQGKASFLTNLHTRLGNNWRMSEPHAAITLTQLRRLDEFIAHRTSIAAGYDAALPELGLTPVAIPTGAITNYYKYIAYLPDGIDRGVLKKRLREEFDVSLSGEVYEVPLHLQPVYEPWSEGPLPGAEELCARHVCLPVSAVMTTAQLDHVIHALREVLP
jgi:dTDP-4-amino-4,6-dideoxygalactose transaminase